MYTTTKLSMVLFLLASSLGAMANLGEKNPHDLFAMDAISDPQLQKARKDLHEAIAAREAKKVRNLLDRYGDLIVAKSGHVNSTLPRAYESGDKEIIKLIQQFGGRVVQFYNDQGFISDRQQSTRELKDLYNRLFGIKETQEELAIAENAKKAIQSYLEGSFGGFETFLNALPKDAQNDVILDVHERLNFTHNPNADANSISEKSEKMELSSPYFENERLLALFGYVDLLASLINFK